jgi:hypothetical protein
LIEFEWVHRLDVENVLRVLASTDVEVRIVLKGEADQIGNGVFGLPRADFLLVAR